MKKTTTSLLFSTALTGLLMHAPAFAEDKVNTKDEISVPKVLLPYKPTPPTPSESEQEGDNLGNHTADKTLKMEGKDIIGLVTLLNEDSSAVNVETLKAYVKAHKGDDLGNHIATMDLNLKNHKIVNVANAYDGDNGDAVNIWTLKEYLKRHPGDDLGNHVATRDLLLNNYNIHTGQIIGFDQNTGAPIISGGISISNTTITGLTLPTKNSDAANKEYVDSMVGGIKGDNLGDHKATKDLSLSNFKITDLADPSAGTDGVNLRTLEKKISEIDVEHPIVISEAYRTKPVAIGTSSLAGGNQARADGVRNIALGESVTAIGTENAVIGANAKNLAGGNNLVFGSGAVNDIGVSNIVLGSGARNYKESYNIAIGIQSSTNNATQGGLSAIAIGESTNATGQHAMAVGPVAKATGNRTLALGSNANAGAAESIAIGRTATIATTAANGVTIGRDSKAEGAASTALGAYATTGPAAGNGLALGRAAQSNASGSTALGAYSVADVINSVSVGHATLQRKIMNVADPTLDFDTVNLRTLKSYASRYKAGDGVSFGTADASGLIPINVDNTVVRTSGNQTIAGNKTLTGTTVFSAIPTANNQVFFRDNTNLTRAAFYALASDSSFRIKNFTADGTATSAELIMDKDGLIRPLTGRFDASNRVISMLADPVNPQDAVNLRTLMDRIGSGDGDNLGNHTAVQNINANNFKVVNVAAPTAGGDATNKTYVDNLVSGSTAAGSGITVTKSGTVSTVAVDATVVRTTGNQNIAGTKTFTTNPVIEHGGTKQILMRNASQVSVAAIEAVEADRSIRLINYDGDGTITGSLHIRGSDGAIFPVGSSFFHANNKQIIGVADPVNPQDAVNLRSLQNAISPFSRYKAGDGVSFGTADASGLISINVDNTVVRTSGNQTINGTKSFTTSINIDSNGANGVRMRTAAGLLQGFVFTDASTTQIRNYNTDGSTIASALVIHNNGRIYPSVGNLDGGSKTINNVADPVVGIDAVNLRTLKAYYTGGSGINISGSGVVSTDNTVVRTTGNQNVSGVKTFTDEVRIGDADGTILTKNRLTTVGNFGMSAGPDIPGYNDTAGKTVTSTSSIWMGGQTVNIVTNLNTAGNYTGYPMYFGVMRPAGGVIDSMDNGNGMIMALSHRSVRIFRGTELNGEFYQNSPDKGTRFFTNSTNFNTGDFNVSSQGMNITLDARKFRTDISSTTNGIIRVFGDVVINGQSRATGGHATSSDARLKKNVETITGENGLNIIRKLRPVSYDFKEGNRHAEGVIAQEVKEVLPHAVSVGPDGYMAVEYDQMIAPLIASVKALDAEMDQLRKENDELKAKIDALTKK